MNTIEQAREVSQALRSIFINEDVPSVQARKWADTIDALIADRNEWRELREQKEDWSDLDFARAIEAYIKEQP